jgi:hypothetical protein
VESIICPLLYSRGSVSSELTSCPSDIVTSTLPAESPPSRDGVITPLAPAFDSAYWSQRYGLGGGFISSVLKMRSSSPGGAIFNTSAT